MKTNFQGKKYQNNMHHTIVSLIMSDSVITVNKKHYAQTLLKKCKYEIKKKKMENFINDD